MRSPVEPTSPPIHNPNHRGEPMRGLLYSLPIAALLWTIVLLPLLLG